MGFLFLCFGLVFRSSQPITQAESNNSIIRNESKKTQTVMADDFQIIDAQGRQFSTDSEASTALLMSGASKDFLIRQIQPSLTKNAVTVFRVPADAINGSMTLVVPEKGLFSSGKATVAFNWKKNS